MENRKYSLVLSVSLALHPYLHLSLCMCLTVANTYTKMFVCTLKYLCVGVCNPWELAPCLKKQQNHCTCHLRASQQHCSPAPGISPPWTEQSATCRVSQQDQRRRKPSGWELAVYRVRAKACFCHEWPAERRWQSVTCTVPPSNTDQQTEECLPPQFKWYKKRSWNILGWVKDYHIMMSV